jgi:hypothetical protein
MRQRIGLLARKDKTVLFSSRQSGFAVRATHLVAFPFRHEFSGLMQAPFGLDHVAGGEAIFAAGVLAEFDQTGRAAHRAHDFVELLDPVAVTMREDSHITPREGRLLLRDRVQPQIGTRDNPRAIAARDLAVHLGAIGLGPLALDASILDTFGRRADLALRLESRCGAAALGRTYPDTRAFLLSSGPDHKMTAILSHWPPY